MRVLPRKIRGERPSTCQGQLAQGLSQCYSCGAFKTNPNHKLDPMKAAIVPAANSRWEVKQTETPEPGPGQVLIKIHASGLCYSDVHQTRGELPGNFPRTLGHEPVGEIVRSRPWCDNAQNRRSRRCSLGSAYLRPLRVVRPQQAHVLRASRRHRHADRRRPR